MVSPAGDVRDPARAGTPLPPQLLGDDEPHRRERRDPIKQRAQLAGVVHVRHVERDGGVTVRRFLC